MCTHRARPLRQEVRRSASHAHVLCLTPIPGARVCVCIFSLLYSFLIQPSLRARLARDIVCASDHWSLAHRSMNKACPFDLHTNAMCVCCLVASTIRHTQFSRSSVRHPLHHSSRSHLALCTRLSVRRVSSAVLFMFLYLRANKSSLQPVARENRH